MTANDQHITHRHIERARQRSRQLPVGRTIHRRRSDTHSERAVVFSNHFAARRARHSFNFEVKPVLLL
jgi:hypothetical protein